MWYCVELNKTIFNDTIAYILRGVGCTVYRINV